MSKKVIGIWAQTKNGVIGKDQVMPWHLPAELQHFKQTTTGHAILMGRVTYEGLNKRVLPNRTNIILSRDDKYDVENETVLLKTSVEDVLNWYKSQDLSLFLTTLPLDILKERKTSSWNVVSLAFLQLFYA